MSIHIADCPHCGANKVALQMFGFSIFPQETALAHRLPSSLPTFTYDISAGAKCPACFKPVALLLRTKNSLQQNSVAAFASKLMADSSSIDTIGFHVVSIWPGVPLPSIPAHIPAQVERALIQAERNYPIAGNEEASAMMYRRTLELALKDKFASLSGSLAKRIKTLVTEKILPEAMGDWADEIRDLGNDAAHEPSAIEKTQLTAIRGFADATLRYLYTLPAEIEARRKVVDA